MGLGDADLLDDGDGGGEGKGPAVAVSCSICLDVVMANGDRSWAKLQCGHQFHLDCIGSAFNIKGAMQCPNCRKIEKGQWLYANGNRPLPDFSMDDWAHDEDLYDPTYSEMSFGDHWCPFSGLTRLPSSFDEGEFPSSAYHGLLGHNAVFTEHAPVASTTHPCPYIAYFGPIHPSISTSSGNVSDGSGFNNHWSANGEVPSAYPFPSMDAHYHIWDQLPPLVASSQIVTADQPSVPSGAQRTARNSDVPRPGMHPFIVGHSSARRAPSSVTSSVLPPYPGPLTRPHDCPVQPNFQQSTTAPIARTSLVSNARRPNTHRGLGQVAPPTSSPDQSSGFYFSSGSSGMALPEASRTFQEAENRVHVWERDHRQHHHPPFLVDRESIWAPFHPPTDAGIRSSSFRQRHGSQSWS